MGGRGRAQESTVPSRRCAESRAGGTQYTGGTPGFCSVPTVSHKRPTRVLHQGCKAAFSTTCGSARLVLPQVVSGPPAPAAVSHWLGGTDSLKWPPFWCLGPHGMVRPSPHTTFHPKPLHNAVVSGTPGHSIASYKPACRALGIIWHSNGQTK